MSVSSGRSNGSEDQTAEFQQQVDAYIAWVNSQLKKQSGNKPVKDLKTDFQDGIVLVKLIEIITGSKLQGVIFPAKSEGDKINNIKIVLQYLSSHKIRVHHIAERDIVNGNVKSLMRLILTLAAHFKPSSVGMRKSASAATANASAALGDIRKHVSSPGGLRSRWKSGSPLLTDNRKFIKENLLLDSPTSSRSVSLQSESSEAHPSDTEHTPQRRPRACSSNAASPNLPHRSHKNESGEPMSSTPVRNLASFSDEVIVGSGGSLHASYRNNLLMECYDELDDELSDTRNLVATLQNLLLNGVVPDKDAEDVCDGAEEEGCLPFEASTQKEQELLLKSKLDLSLHENDHLKKELAEIKEESRSVSASKSALRTRAQQQEKEMLSLKQQVLKLNLENEKLVKERSYMTTQLEESRKTRLQMTDQLSERDKTIRQMREEIGVMSSQLKKIGIDSKSKLASTQKLELQVQELTHQLRILQRYNQSANRANGNENAVISESLNSLRSNLPPHDSRQHIIDTLEQAVLSLTDQAKSRRRGDSNHERNSTSHVAHSYPSRSKTRDSAQNHRPTSPSTTVIYFTERNMTPVRATIYKKIGDITLKDFKAILHQPAPYKYNFKALDPEFGTVKKEVFHDDDIVPGWEGKIVAWLEKDNSAPNG